MVSSPLGINSIIMPLPPDSHLTPETSLSFSLPGDRVRRLFEILQDAIAIVDHQGHALDVNPAACDLLGRGRQELLGQSLGEFLEPECDFAQVWQALQHPEHAQPDPLQGEWQWVRPNGQRCLVQYTVIPHFLPEGHLLVMRHLPDRPPANQPNEDLNNSSDLPLATQPIDLLNNNLLNNNIVAASEKLLRLQLALKVANIGVWDWNPQTNQVSFSSQWKVILGYEEDEITNALHEWESRVHPDDLPRVYVQIGRHLRKETSFYQTEHRLRCKDGTYKWIVDQGRIVARDDQGNPVQFIGINYDISARKASELELENLSQQLQRSQAILKESNLFLNSVLEAIPGFFFAKDRQGRHIALNSNLASFFGKPITEILNKTDADLLPSEIASSMMLKDQEIMSQDISQRFEEVVPTHGVDCTYLTIKMPLKDDRGQIIGMIGLAQDISDRKAIEVALADKAQELEQAMQEIQRTQMQMIHSEKMSSLGQLVAGIAHEINNPVSFIHGNLTHIKTYTQDLLDLVHAYQQHIPNPPLVLQEQIEAIDLDFLSTDIVKILESLQVGSDRICEIVLSLHNFSRLDEAEFKAVNIHEGIDNTLLILQHRLQATDTRPVIQVSKQYGNLPKVECYAGQLNQVFMNLLSNAIDALEDSNQHRTFQDIERHPNKIWIDTEVCDRNRIKITIADNGKGILKAARSQLFNPFFTTKPIGKGTGLGLSISYQIVTERHHGKLWCDSTPEVGSKFWIEIPVQQ
jgi:PAS domain S-box-containing protein